MLAEVCVQLCARSVVCLQLCYCRIVCAVVGMCICTCVCMLELCMRLFIGVRYMLYTNTAHPPQQTPHTPMHIHNCTHHYTQHFSQSIVFTPLHIHHITHALNARHCTHTPPLVVSCFSNYTGDAKSSKR